MNNAETLAYEALRTAQVNEHKGSSSFAVFCAKEAAARFNEERFALCAQWAIESLSYSVGKFAPEYAKCVDLYDRI